MSDDGEKLKTEATPKAVHSADIPVLDEKTRLIITAQELGILVDDSWDVARIRAEIQIARDGRADLQVKGAVPPKEYSDPDFDPGTKADKLGVPVKLERDYWTGGQRIPKGTEISVAHDKAQSLINSGVASRNDPLPR